MIDVLIDKLEVKFKEKDNIEKMLEDKEEEIEKLRQQIDKISEKINRFFKKDYSDNEDDDDEEDEIIETDEEDEDDENLYGKRDNCDFNENEIIDKPSNRRLLKRMKRFINRDNQDPLEQRSIKYY